MTESTAAGLEPINVDTSLLGEQTRAATGNPAIDAAVGQFYPMASETDFLSALSDSAIMPNAFTALLNNAEPTVSSGSGLRGRVLDYAKQFIGTPYVWGGTSPKGFDCSGLLQYTLGKFGVRIPRIAAQQAGVGKRTNIAQLQPGDFVVKNDGSHIAFYLGNGQILEAPRTGLNVRIRKLGAKEAFYGVHIKYPGES